MQKDKKDNYELTPLQQAADWLALFNSGVITRINRTTGKMALIVLEGHGEFCCPDGYNYDENGFFSLEDPSLRIPFTVLSESEYDAMLHEVLANVLT